MKDKVQQKYAEKAQSDKRKEISKKSSNATEDEENDALSLDKSLHCLRIEFNRHTTVFLYYKVYPKSNSAKFPQDRSAIFFYFDNQQVDEKFFHYYISCAGQIENVEFGNYINRKGASSKRRVINFAIVKFDEKEALDNLLNRLEMQLKINAIIERSKNRTVDFSYNPLEDLNEQGDEIEEGQPDADGFMEVTANKSNRFSKNGLSFRVMKEKKENSKHSDVQENEDNDGFEEFKGNESNNEGEEGEAEEAEEAEAQSNDKKKKKKKTMGGDFYWNYQIRDKKKQMYDELKNLFEQDKQIIKDMSFKKRKIEEDDY